MRVLQKEFPQKFKFSDIQSGVVFRLNMGGSNSVRYMKCKIRYENRGVAACLTNGQIMEFDDDLDIVIFPGAMCHCGEELQTDHIYESS